MHNFKTGKEKEKRGETASNSFTPTAAEKGRRFEGEKEKGDSLPC